MNCQSSQATCSSHGHTVLIKNTGKVSDRVKSDISF